MVETLITRRGSGRFTMFVTALVALLTLILPTEANANLHYGQLTKSVVIDGHTLPPGNYVSIQFDGGDVWLTSIEGDGSPIPKSSVTVVDNIVFEPPLMGTLKDNSIIYTSSPSVNWVGILKDVYGKPLGLSLRNPEIMPRSIPMRPASVPKGTTFKVFMKQGGDYLVNINVTASGEVVPVPYRFPIEAVAITSGNLNAGKPDPIPPKPKASLPPKIDYLHPAVKPPSTSFGDYFVIFGMPFIAGSIILFVIGFLVRQGINQSGETPGVADYGIPHTKFQKTDDGFTVTFVKSSSAFYQTTHRWKTGTGSGSGPALIGYYIGMIVMGFFIMLWYGIESFLKTVIKVDRDLVTVGGQPMPRADFGGFNVHHALSGQEGQVAVLGYSFGRRSLPFGGVWDEGHAQEVASALNAHLRYSAPADPHAPSPEMLREARPTEF